MSESLLRQQYDEMVAENAQLTARIADLEAAQARDAATIATLTDDLEHALASVGAFRQAIEDVWSKSAGESGEDGFIVSYVIPVGVLHRAIGLARGTDVGGKLLKQLRDAQTAVALLNSMVLSGEDHSDTSRAAVRAALGG